MSQTVKATGAVLVKLKRCGLRFEVAALKPKIAEWRARAETDLDEVVVIRAVFSNASKVTATHHAVMECWAREALVRACT